MRLYSGMSRNFIDDTVRNQIAGKLEDAFFRHFRYRPSRGEVNSWRNSRRADEAVIIELKQWDTCSPAVGERLVTTRVGGEEARVVGDYRGGHRR